MIESRISQYSEHCISVNGLVFFSLKNYTLAPITSSFPGHTHYFLELSLVKKGRGVYKIDNKLVEMAPGDIFVFNGSEKHAISEVYQPETMELLVLHFEPEFLYSIEGSMLDFGFLKVFFERNYGFENKLRNLHKDKKKLEENLLTLENEFTQRLPCYELAVKIKFMDLMVTLLRYYDYHGGDSIYCPDHKGIDSVRKIKEYVHRNFDHEITLDEIAKYVNLSASHVSTVFKKYNGISLWRYINSIRVYSAITLLTSTDETVLSVALSCGFNNSANFNKTFKQHTGMKPSEYRKNS